MRGVVIFTKDHPARWLYSGGQKRLIRTIDELTELRKTNLLEPGEVELSKGVLDGIPVMPGSALP